MPVHTPLPKWPTLNLERGCEGRVCGVDEAGCAPLAGPVVAAAVVLPAGPKPRKLRGLTDSKLLSAHQREHYFDIIRHIAEVGVGLASVGEIERLNIFHADMLAMQRAVEALADPPDFALVDGRSTPALGCAVKAVVKGDRRSLSIAAASVIAKVVRDRLMRKLAVQYPAYGWHTNAGYGTDAHYLGLLRKGPTEHHRRGFAPLNTLFGPGGSALAKFRFCRLREKPDVGRLKLLELRRDLHAVFDGSGHHLGVVKNLRGRWTFQAIGYDDEQEPVPAGGPCSGWHGERLDKPELRMLARLLGRALE
ncbi:MAG: ribonuclease HII [Xanthomonadales bacterium]|nr:ribonuclease HII [Xanthomonadales bacterium]